MKNTNENKTEQVDDDEVADEEVATNLDETDDALATNNDAEVTEKTDEDEAASDDDNENNEEVCANANKKLLAQCHFKIFSTTINFLTQNYFLATLSVYFQLVYNLE